MDCILYDEFSVLDFILQYAFSVLDCILQYFLSWILFYISYLVERSKGGNVEKAWHRVHRVAMTIFWRTMRVKSAQAGEGGQKLLVGI